MQTKYHSSNTLSIYKLMYVPQLAHSKFRLDNKAALQYLDRRRLYDNENCRWVSGPATYWDSTGYGTQP